MTSDEKRQQYGELLVDLEEAEQNLAALYERATRFQENVREVTKAVESTISESRGQSTGYHHLSSLMDIQNNSKYEKDFNLDTALGLIKEMKEAEARLDNLRQRKAALSKTA
jgi:hypothetical protein